MRIRDSGMPDRCVWENLFDVQGILTNMELDS